MIHVCVVDDDAMLLAGMKRVLRRVSAEVNLTLCESGEEALSVLNAHRVDVLISDLRMPRMDGQALMTTAQVMYPHMARVIMTGDLDPQQAFALQLVAHRIVAKPIDAATVLSLVQELGDSSERSDVIEMSWAHSAARRLAEQRATSISVDVARSNPWLAVLLLQATNGGFVTGRESRHVESAVRSLGSVHLAIILDRLQLLFAESAQCVPSHAGELASTLGALLTLSRENADSLAPVFIKRYADSQMSVADFVGIVESAVLLRAAASGAMTAGWADREMVLRTAWDAARLGVPMLVVDAVRESVSELAGDSVSAGAVVQSAFELYGHGSVM